ncbi:dockerin type I domain-containing protein [Ruminococcus sp. HUN007]|uniref:dockerin type I domain-containing protein n=1 Tax=Ruminococcus sp. HUN007 TaxID=1514668 RepID=UPI000679B74E|nr:dockerin type I domain-containing protein [Ruminococcus sp. HUN007]
MSSDLKKASRRTAAGISALCLAGGSLSAGWYGAVNDSTVKAVEASLYGDFNCDGTVDITDVSELTKYLSDPESVKASEQGLKNADVYYPGIDLNYDDVQAIIENLAGCRELWTREIVKSAPAVIYGDADCDGDVDNDDVEAIVKYLKDSKANPLTREGIINADVFYPGIELTYEDAQAVAEHLGGFRDLWTREIDNGKPAVIYGDADCDGDVDFSDVDALLSHLSGEINFTFTKEDPERVRKAFPEDELTDDEAEQLLRNIFERYLPPPLTPEGLVNADAFYPGIELTYDDCQVIVENLAGFRDLWTRDKDNSQPAVIYGDADCDGDVDFDDVSALLAYFKDKEANPLTREGIINADAFYPGIELTYEDGQAIVESLADLRKLWTRDIDNTKPAVIYGDADCDGDVDFDDVSALLAYFKDKEANPLTPEGIINADAFYPGNELTKEDCQVIVENLAGFRPLWTREIDNSKPAPIYGDADCDGDVDFDDVDALNKYFKDKEANPLTPEGIINADAFYLGSELNYDDLQVIIENLAGLRDLWTREKVQVSYASVLEDAVTAGDFNCDNVVSVADAVLLNSYINGATDYKPSGQALKNANVFKPESTELDLNDVAAIAECAGGKTALPADKLTTVDSEHLAGDFNCDNAVNIADLSMLYKYITKTSDYQPSKQGLANANVYKKDTTEVDINDLQVLAEFFAAKNELNSDKLATVDSEHLAGDFNCDNAVNIADLSMLYKYITKTSDYQPSKQGLANANVYKKDSTEVDIDDLQVLAEFLGKRNELNSDKLTTVDSEHLAGDFNCDNAVNIADLSMLYKYITKTSDYQPSKQGLANANVYKKDSTEVDIDDLQMLAEFFAGKNKLNSDELTTVDNEHLSGDFNCDNKVDITDLSMYFKYIYGVSDYHPSKQGLENIDVFWGKSDDRGSDNLHVLEDFLAGKTTLPAKEHVPSDFVPVYGDFNCDNKFDILDALMLHRYIANISDYVPSEQGKKNANVTRYDSELNYDDLKIMTGLLAPKEKEEIDLSKLKGDVNADGKINTEDLLYLKKVLIGSEKYRDTCDVNEDGSFSTYDFVLLAGLILNPSPAQTPATAAPTQTPASAQPAATAPTQAPASAQPAATAPTQAPASAQPAATAPTQAPASAQPAATAPTQAPASAQPAAAAPTQTPA